MLDYAEKVQHLRRCSTHNIRQPRVACTIVWQPWAIKSATPMVLKCTFPDAISLVLQYDSMVCYAEITIIYNIDSNDA